MKLLSNNRLRWFGLAFLWLVMLAVGISGFFKQGSADDVNRGLADNLYLTLQLATLDYDGSSGPMNWQLQIARFVVPILAAGTILQTASSVFRDEFRRYRLRFAKRHTIVCGLGETGARLAASFAAAGETVVAIEPDASVTASSGVAEKVSHVLVAAGTDTDALAVAGIDRAARIVVCTGSDAANVQVARAVVQATAGRRGRPLRASVQLDDADLSVLMRAADLESSSGVRLSYFNLHERAARALLAESGPELAGFETSPHMMLVGLGQFGRSLLLALCQQFAEHSPGVTFCPTLIDRAARGRWESMRLQHPALDAMCEPTVVDLDLDQPEPDQVDGFIDLLGQDPPMWVVVAFDDEAVALSNAMFLHQHLPWGRVPIVVRMRSEDGLGGLLSPHPDGHDAFPGVKLFPFLDRACTAATVDGGVREQLAQAVHEDYLATLAPDAPEAGLRKPWDDLSDADRELSRSRVDGILADLDAIGCDLVPLRRWGAPEVELTGDEVEALAGREHQRWFDERSAAGWVHGETKDERSKTNPLLVPWADLDDASRAWNVASAGNLLPMLARNGFEAARRTAS